jgi:hypothetical protein
LRSAPIKNRVAGVDASEARCAANRLLGNASHVKKRTRGVRILTSIENAWRDARFGKRMLLTEPGFTFSVIFTPALGFGADTVIAGALGFLGSRAAASTA